jgi:hypothetical protein
MATKKNISAKRKSKTSPSETIAVKIKKLDKRMAELQDLFGWGLSDAQTDVSRVCYGDLSSQYAILEQNVTISIIEAKRNLRERSG